MTGLGPVQFGIPPETIKDSMELGLGIPAYFVVPSERFVKTFGPNQGINIAEFEFPAYCNFFFKNGKRVCLVVETEEAKEKIRQVFQETLLGPKEWDPEIDFDPSFPVENRPDLMKELMYFRKFGDSLISVDMLLSFVIFDSKTGSVELVNPNNDKEKVVIFKNTKGYHVRDINNLVIATVDADISMPKPSLTNSLSREFTFVPPLFGVTVLGSSHGFDPKGNTSGYVLWMNGRGLMIDPPPNSSSLLLQNSIPPSLIDGVIVTHCHADHDAGTFQKILQEGKVTLLTTPTIMGCFLRKYSALAGLDISFLEKAFIFRPVHIGAHIKIHGGSLRFFYSLHSIPCVGFEAFFGGRSIVFSADHMNDPARIKQLCEDGILSEGRRDSLLAFPWHHDLILHEAGVPPIHTPMETLIALPDEIKRKLYVVHVAFDKVPVESGLNPAKQGVENTIVIKDAILPPHASALEILDLVSSIPLFAPLTMKHASDILTTCKVVEFAAGEAIVRTGDKGDCFYAIMSGEAEVRVEEKFHPQPDFVEQQADSSLMSVTVKRYFAGDYFGEQALITEDAIRTADILAVKPIKAIQFMKLDFIWLLKDTDVVKKMTRLAEIRETGSWILMNENSVLSLLSESQKTQLETCFTKVSVKAGELLWKKDDIANIAALVSSGLFKFSSAIQSIVKKNDSGIHVTMNKTIGSFKELEQTSLKFSRGAFVIDVDAMLAGGKNDADLVATIDSEALVLSEADIKSFFKSNPGVLLAMLKARFIF